ncbi:PQQ-dependent sugar dehydrogenase [Azospirillum sp. RWY-5-1]|nr:PQQ-dependent sugar dehydrogenase [Azospirillum oleiclasticum]
MLAGTAGAIAAAVVLRPGASHAQSARTEKMRLKVVEVADGLDYPWGLAFLPDGSMLVTEREGRLRRILPDGKLSAAIRGVPEVVARGQGGLLDVALDPRFADNRLVYLTYSEPGQGGSGTTAARGRLGEDGLSDVQVIFRQTPKLGTGHHFGSRLVFAPDGTLFITTGDRGQMARAQELSMHQGKVIRIRPDGSIPPDNPFVGRNDARPEIWSYGHRNIQGAALHPTTGRLWLHEHGARGGDEINVPEAGRNYGWPVITYGMDYSGARIGEGTSKPGLEQPIHWWDPSIAPSGMAFCTSDRYPAWRGNLFIGSLRFSQLVRLELDGTTVLKEERFLDEVGKRIRDVRQGPDGFLYVTTDESGGSVLRLEPA